MWAVVRGAVAAFFGDDIIRYALYALGGLAIFVVVETYGVSQSMISQPWGQWWLAGQFGPQFVTRTGGDVSVGGNAIVIGPGSGGIISAVERYRLAREAGFSLSDAVLAVAVSIAENHDGDPSLQHHNDDGSIDTGLWQINSRNAPEFGGIDALKSPTVNAHAAYVLEQRARSFCPWFTYDVSCGPKHTGSYQAFLATAAAASASVDINPWFADAYSYASTWLNVPYLFGGCSRSGIDCSCFVQAVLAHEHITAPRVTTQQIVWATPISRDQLVPGDIVFFDNTCTDCGANPTHEGMYIGAGKMIDAGGTHVQINDIWTGFYASKNPRYGRPHS
jgi:cell wall-associated NlpC family hydrolase